MPLLGKILKKRNTEEVVYHTQRDSENRKTQNSKRKKKKHHKWIRRLILTYTQKALSVMGNPQGLSPSFLIPHLYRKSVYLIDVAQTPDVHHRELCLKFYKISKGKTIHKRTDMLYVNICCTESGGCILTTSTKWQVNYIPIYHRH